jgi:hypothetical protein
MRLLKTIRGDPRSEMEGFSMSKKKRFELNHPDLQVRIMVRAGIPVTRENYLNLAYLGEPPEQLSAEEECELPEELQCEPVNTPRRKSRITYVGPVPDDDPRYQQGWTF